MRALQAAAGAGRQQQPPTHEALQNHFLNIGQTAQGFSDWYCAGFAIDAVRVVEWAIGAG